VLNQNNRQAISVQFAGHEFILLGSGCCYWPKKEILIVSDLHLEKGSFLVMKGQPIPTADTRDTLDRLKNQIIELQPKMVLCLGDNVHDPNALLRMDSDDLNTLQSLCNTTVDWCWIIGNHDKVHLMNHSLLHKFVNEVSIENICFTHELQENKPFQIMGHYHPKITIIKKGVRITGKCFAVTKNIIIMPSFGSYTGGLDIDDKAYISILKSVSQYYLIFKNYIFLAK
jgi:DNA ligase-associated metallophosphoesterase